MRSGFLVFAAEVKAIAFSKDGKVHPRPYPPPPHPRPLLAIQQPYERSLVLGAPGGDQLRGRLLVAWKRRCACLWVTLYTCTVLMHERSGFMIRSIDELIDKLIDNLIDKLIDKLIDSGIDRQIVRQIDRQILELIDNLIDNSTI